MAPSIYEQESRTRIIPDGENASFEVNGKQITVLALPGNQLGHISRVVSGEGCSDCPVTTSPKCPGPYHFGSGTLHWEK